MDSLRVDGAPLTNGKNRSSSIGTAVDDRVMEDGNIAASAHDDRVDGWSTSSNTHEAAVRLRREKWLMNYQEAAIYLEEGNNNEKFESHPTSQSALPAYLIAHHSFFHVIDFLASLLLLGLAVIERPAVAKIHVPESIHGSVEIFGIFILSLDLFFKARWQGPRNFFTHKRSVTKMVLLLVMIVEAITVISRQASHFRVTRALRPFFLLDTHYCRGIRRFVRQLMLSMPPILELLVLLMFIMLIFSILGFYLFSGIPENTFFWTLQNSFISLFVLLTTANYPDVMMPSYKESYFSVIFFIIYITIEIYFCMNLFLAVVYDTFTSQEKSKMKKLILHERDACQRAFRLLVSTRNPNHISLRHFAGLITYYKPRTRKEEIYLMFKALNSSGSGHLSLEEFYSIYSVRSLRWKDLSSGVRGLWFEKLPYCLNRMMTGIHWLVSIKWFEYFIYVVIVANFGTILYETIELSMINEAALKNRNVTGEALHSSTEDRDRVSKNWYSILFTAIYSVEAILKITGLGLRGYFFDGWNIFDFAVTLLSIAGTAGDFSSSQDDFSFFIILRPLRLIRIFKARKRYRDVLGTLFILVDRLWSLCVTLILLYYFYAIIGMELFSDVELVDCCLNNTGIAPYYDNQTGYYQYNNYEDIFKSGITLFELTVVNNWFIIMEGYAYTYSEWSRIYFMTFYIVTMIVMTVVVASILEAFMFKIQFRRTTQESGSIDFLKREVSLCLDEIHMINNVQMAGWTGTVRRQAEAVPADFYFMGEKYRDKNDLSLQMYADEVKEWIAESIAAEPTPESVTSTPQHSRLLTVSSGISLDDLPNIVGREDDLDTSNQSVAMVIIGGPAENDSMSNLFHGNRAATSEHDANSSRNFTGSHSSSYNDRISNTSSQTRNRRSMTSNAQDHRGSSTSSDDSFASACTTSTNLSDVSGAANRSPLSNGVANDGFYYGADSSSYRDENDRPYIV